MNAYMLAYWEAWLAKQPDTILKAAEQCPPWGIYQFRANGDPAYTRLDGLLCTICDYFTDGSLRVRFTQEYGNLIASSEILIDDIMPEQLFFTPPHGQIN